MGEQGKNFLIVVTIAILGLLFYVYVVPKPPRQEAPRPVDRGNVGDYLTEIVELPGRTFAEQNKIAPDFIYPDINNHITCLSDFIGRKDVVLIFWTTSNRDCQNQLPIMQEFYDIHGRRVEIIAITSEGESLSGTIKSTVRAKELTFINLHDPSRKISDMYYSETLPYVVYINREGKIVGAEAGFNPAIAVTITRVFDVGRR